MIHHYAKLGLRPGASRKEIRNSFRQMAKTCHPDAEGGNAVKFAQIKDAYDALSDDLLRERYDGFFKRAQARRRENAPQTPKRPFTAKPEAKAKPAAAAAPQEPRISRLMSIALARSGNVLLQNLDAQLIVEPTTPEGLWPTTKAKFGPNDPARLARHVIQIRVTGGAELARSVKVRATEFGVGIFAARDAEKNPSATRTRFSQPLTIRVTIPLGSKIHLTETSGSISLGDLEGEIRARLDGRTVLRAGKMKRAGITLEGKSKAFLTQLEGDADIIMNDASKMVLDGRIGRLRAVVESQGQMEILASAQNLQAEIKGHGLIHAKNTITTAHINAYDHGYARLAELKTFLLGSKQGQARVDVLKKPGFVPVGGSRNRTRGQA